MISRYFNEEEFLMTFEYRRFVGFCRACHRHRHIAVCSGDPGVGKTWAANKYARTQLIKQATNALLRGEPIAEDLSKCRSILITAQAELTPKRLYNQIEIQRRRLNTAVSGSYRANDPTTNYETPWVPANYLEVILVDEADLMKPSLIEALRLLYDSEDQDFGLVLMGMTGLEKAVNRYEQLYSRIGGWMEFEKFPTDRDTRDAILHIWGLVNKDSQYDQLTDENAIGEIITYSRRNFRLAKQLLLSCEEILIAGKVKTIDRDVVLNARDALLTGAKA
jgi:DNA transposition AAA+ family ATPase